MAISTNAAFANFNDAALIANEVIYALTANRVLAQFLRSDKEFVKDRGSYGQGKTVNIPVVPSFTTQIATSAGAAVTFQTPTATNVSLTLDSIAYTPFASNDVDAALSNASFRDSYIAQMARDHGSSIEKQMFLDTFNVAAIDANAIGAFATPTNYKLIRTLWKAFKDAKVPESVLKVAIVSTTQYMDLLADQTVSRLLNPDKSQTLDDGVLLKTLNILVLPSTELPTNLALTNITGAGTEQVGFAFTADSIVMATRELPKAPGNMVAQTIVRNDDVNLATRLTVSYDANVVGGSLKYNLETLFGTKIFRPSTVFPIFGGVA
jgi:hypothetical protein